MEKYQIFISYRRDGGDALAGRLADRFSALGYKVFFDVESMRSGTFNTQILDAIAQCDGVLLVLPPNALDRCVNSDDWVRQELAFALKHNKTIIPIMMRGFEFPRTLPADIDNIRNMEGVTASSEYFDAVVDKIKNLLKFDPRNDQATTFSVYKDPDFPEEVIQDIIFYHLLNNEIPDTLKNKVNASLMKYYDLHGPEYKGVPGRKILHTVECDGKRYHIYDVFCYDGKKYAYGLESNVKSSNQQVGVFFTITESEGLKPILIGTSNAVIHDIETSTLFTWYVKNRRGFGGVPDVLLPLQENQMRHLSADNINNFADFIGLGQEDANEISNLGTDKIIEYLRATNENLLSTRISGIYNGIGVFVGDGNCYGNRFQGYYAGRVIRTPIRKKVILDIVPTTVKNCYIALVYDKIKKKKIDYLLEGPEYYLITKQENSHLDFCRISEENLEFWCGKYFERFALIYMQVKLLIINAFFKK